MAKQKKSLTLLILMVWLKRCDNETHFSKNEKNVFGK